MFPCLDFYAFSQQDDLYIVVGAVLVRKICRGLFTTEILVFFLLTKPSVRESLLFL